MISTSVPNSRTLGHEVEPNRSALENGGDSKISAHNLADSGPDRTCTDAIMSESFPDALDAIRDAFNLPDPTPQLLELIRAHPELPTIGDIVVIYLELVQQSPSQIDKLTGTLVNLKSSTEFTIAANDRLGKSVPIVTALALNLELNELLSSELAHVKDASVTPSNEHLIASLLSAVAIKYSLCNSTAFSSAVDRGLCHQHDTYRFDVATREVLVLGACLQLSMSGSYFCDQKGFDARHALGALERIKEVGVVKHPDGQRLLEVCGEFDHILT